MLWLRKIFYSKSSQIMKNRLINSVSEKKNWMKILEFHQIKFIQFSWISNYTNIKFISWSLKIIWKQKTKKIFFPNMWHVKNLKKKKSKPNRTRKQNYGRVRKSIYREWEKNGGQFRKFENSNCLCWGKIICVRKIFFTHTHSQCRWQWWCDGKTRKKMWSVCFSEWMKIHWNSVFSYEAFTMEHVKVFFCCCVDKIYFFHQFICCCCFVVWKFSNIPQIQTEALFLSKALIHQAGKCPSLSKIELCRRWLWKFPCLPFIVWFCDDNELNPLNHFSKHNYFSVDGINILFVTL